MRNWARAFRRASFKGIGFWVDNDGPDSGRRVAVHEISGGEMPVVEDMGRATKSFSVSAYVASDLADIEGLALETMCNAPGPGVLVLPMDAFQAAICSSCRRDRSRDENGYVAYDLTFIEAGSSAALPMAGLAVLRDVFTGNLGAVASAMRGAF